jgi:hypothetical protein
MFIVESEAGRLWIISTGLNPVLQPLFGEFQCQSSLL